MKTHAPGPEWLGQRYRGVTAQGGPGPARFLGAGSYGQVYLYQDTHRDNELVAIKQLKLTGVTLQRAAELNNILPRE